MGESKYTVKQAAQKLGISEDAMRMRVSRSAKNPSARGALKTYLDNNVRPPVRYVYLDDEAIPEPPPSSAPQEAPVEAAPALVADPAKDIEIARLQARIELLEARLGDKDGQLEQQDNLMQQMGEFYQRQIHLLQEAIEKQPRYEELVRQAKIEARADMEAVITPVLKDVLKSLKKRKKGKR